MTPKMKKASKTSSLRCMKHTSKYVLTACCLLLVCLFFGEFFCFCFWLGEGGVRGGGGVGVLTHSTNIPT